MKLLNLACFCDVLCFVYFFTLVKTSGWFVCVLKTLEQCYLGWHFPRINNATHFTSFKENLIFKKAQWMWPFLNRITVISFKRRAPYQYMGKYLNLNVQTCGFFLWWIEFYNLTSIHSYLKNLWRSEVYLFTIQPP